MAPRIDRKSLEKRTIRTGQMLKVETDIAGEPVPTVTWGFKDEKIKNERIIIEDEDYHTTFILKKAKRSDSGIYKITAKNVNGTDVAELEIVVICKYFTFHLFHFLIKILIEM